jgi:hypothetical protein
MKASVLSPCRWRLPDSKRRGRDRIVVKGEKWNPSSSSLRHHRLHQNIVVVPPVHRSSCCHDHISPVASSHENSRVLPSPSFKRIPTHDGGTHVNVYLMSDTPHGDNCHYGTRETRFQRNGGVGDGFDLLETQLTDMR